MILMKAGGEVVDADSGASWKPVCVSSCGTAGKVALPLMQGICFKFAPKSSLAVFAAQ